MTQIIKRAFRLAIGDYRLPPGGSDFFAHEPIVNRQLAIGNRQWDYSQALTHPTRKANNLGYKAFN